MSLDSGHIQPVVTICLTLQTYVLVLFGVSHECNMSSEKRGFK